jgi:hypothetical protein
MSLMTRLGLVPSARQIYPSSPWAEGQLAPIVYSDIYGAAVLPTGRTEAMTVPALNKARNLLVTSIARLPLVALDSTGPLPAEQQPTWLYRTDGWLSPYQRMVWTLDDLLFSGHCLWDVTRGSARQILNAERIPLEEWRIDNGGAIIVNDEAVNASSVLYFQAHTEGLLEVAGRTIRAAASIEESVARRAASPVPVMEIHHTDPDTPVDGDEARGMVAGYNKARRDPEGATVFTPAHIELRDHGANADAGAMIEARNAVRLDVANLTNVPAALLDGSVAVASLTYVTTEGKKSEFIELSLTPWIEDIQARLSMDDVVPRGQRVRFDMTELLTPQATPVSSTETRD